MLRYQKLTVVSMSQELLKEVLCIQAIDRIAFY
jgi:hypothetical protein